MNYFEDSLKVMTALDLDATLDCGQTFRWKKNGDSWHGAVGENVFILKHDKKNGNLEICSNKNEFRGLSLKEGIEEYLGLKDSLESIRQSIHDSIIENGYPDFVGKMDEIYRSAYGLRLLRQPPLEMCVEYIISTQMNINMIKMRVERICELFPENRVVLKGNMFYKFPVLSQLKRITTSKFREIGLGYRSEWLNEFLLRIEAKQLEEIKNSSIREKIDFFLDFKGIGYKVANCIILFGYSDFSAFPVDVWISRFMEDNFKLTGNPQSLYEKGRKIFGKYCGYAQEYFFHHSRNLSKVGG